MENITTPPIAEHKHWVERLAQDVIARNPKGPYIVTAGMTTSGPTHLGTLCELLYPQAVVNYLRNEGHAVHYRFSADILDAFDSVPASHKAYEAQLAPFLGKPLCNVPDPQGCCESLGHHFLNDSLEVGKAFGIAPEIILARDLYSSKAMDDVARFFMAHAAQCKEVVGASSLNSNMPADWSPLMPICQNCGKVATTRVTKLETDAYEYACDKDVKYANGCGHLSHNKISDHHYKLTWRLHWPAWMKVQNTSIEGAGMDHHTKGGSWDTCQAVFRDLFKSEPPIGYQFGFILFQGKKYSKSKGIGMGVRALMALLPPQVLAFLLLRPDLAENRDINPTADNLLRVMDEFQTAGRLANEMGLVGEKNEKAGATIVRQSSSPVAEVSRAERKRGLAYALAANNKPVWGVEFSDLLIYYGLYGNWDAVAQKLGHPSDVQFLAPYVQAWAAAHLIPDDYAFKFQPTPSSDPAVQAWAKGLRPEMSALQIHNSVFEISREYNVPASELFSHLYQALIAKPKGPKLGRLVEVLGPARVRDALLPQA